MADNNSSSTNKRVLVTIIQISRDNDEGPQMSKAETHVSAFIATLNRKLRSDIPSHSLAIGYKLPTKDKIQVTLETPFQSSDQPSDKTPETLVRGVLPGRQEVLKATLNHSILDPQGPAIAPIVEFALTSFPISRVTPAFKTKIETELLEFEEIVARESEGDMEFAYGWTVGAKETQGFLCVHGWKSVDSFRRSTSTNAFKEAMPIYEAWVAPAEVWLVERATEE